MSTTRWKFLDKSGRRIVSRSGSLNWKLGEWNVVEGHINLCSNGLHCSKKIYEAFSYVPGSILARVEVRGKHESSDDKEAWAAMRIVEAYKWTKKDSVALSIFTAELCIKEYEKLYPNDTRPRDAIEAARAVLLSDTAKNRAKASAARSAAELAAWSAESAARSAADSAAWSAESAAESAARSAESAAESAVWSAESAARSAADSAAWSAESAARSAESAARSAESAARSAAKNRTINKIEKWFIAHLEEMEKVK